MRSFLITILFLLLASVAQAEDPISTDIYSKYPSKKVVGVFIDVPQNIIADERVSKMIMDALTPQFPENKFKILPIDDTMTAMQSYAVENNRKQLKKGDMENISACLGLDYAMLIGIKQTAPKMQMILMVATYKTTVTCSSKFFKATDFDNVLAVNKITKDGSSSSLTLLGTPDFYAAYEEAVKAALSEIKIDANNL